MEKRDIKKILEEIEQMATIDINVALSCFYVLFDTENRPYIGISVRFAEIVASSWRNIDTGARVVLNDGETLVVEGYVRDSEKNSNVRVEVQRKIIDERGYALPPEKVVQLTNATLSIAFRNAIFKAVPAAIFTSVIKKMKMFVIENISASNVAEDTIAYFGGKGVTQEELSKRLCVDSIDNMSSENLFLLIGLMNGIEDGDTTVAQIFGRRKKSKRSSMFNADKFFKEETPSEKPKKKTKKKPKKKTKKISSTT